MIGHLLMWLLLSCTPACAFPVAIRSGEHADFSRLVISLPANATWRFEEVRDGYRLATDIPDARFETRGVFRLIPKTRLKGLVKESGGRLFFETAKNITARHFTLDDGSLVIDFRTVIETPSNTGAPSEPPDPAPVATEGLAIPKTIQPVAIGTPHLDLYWKTETILTPDAPPPPSPEIRDRSPAPATPAPPNPQIAEIEGNLTREIGRAASQGLIAVDPTQSAVPLQRDEAKSKAGPPPQPPPDPIAPQDHIAYRLTTAVDRDQLQMSHDIYTKTGETCPPESYFDIAAWADDRPALDQIGEARRRLLGEFDIPDQTWVIALARIYIAFGFGVEARALLADLAEPAPNVAALLFLAAVLDEDRAAAAMPLARMTDCESAVALWALLGASPPPEKGAVNFSAVTRSYAALPPDLRQVLGPKLVSKLIAIGAPDVAQSIRMALARVSIDDEAALDVVDARLSHEAGSQEAAPALEKLSQRNAPEGVEALLLLVDEQLADRQTVPPAQVEQALALAFELSGAPEAPALVRAAALGYASQHKFDAAFDTLAAWPQSVEPLMRAKTHEKVLTMLLEQPDDALFLRLYFSQREGILKSPPGKPVRTALANRLVELGMADAATEILKTSRDFTQSDKLIFARAALVALDPAAALAHLGGVDGIEAEKLRGDALSRLGLHDGARSAYLRAGEDDKARAEAWHQGDWNTLRHGGDAVEKNFIEAFDTQRNIGGGDDPGPIRAARSLLAASKEERKALQDMLDRLGKSGADE